MLPVHSFMMIKSLLQSILLIYVLLCVALFFLQRSMIFHPTEAIPHNFNTIRITQSNHTVEALEVNPTAKHTAIYLGGNAENIIYTAAELMAVLPEHRVLLLKYRGYAGADGKPSEQALYADVLTLFDHLKTTAPITVIGRSLGSGVATYLATERPIDKLVLITPFESVLGVARATFPWLPVSWLLRDRFDSLSRAPDLQLPTLLIKASQDEVIPAANTDALIEALPTNTLQVHTIAAGHNDVALSPTYYATIRHFISSQ